MNSHRFNLFLEMDTLDTNNLQLLASYFCKLSVATFNQDPRQFKSVLLFVRLSMEMLMKEKRLSFALSACSILLHL